MAGASSVSVAASPATRRTAIRMKRTPATETLLSPGPILDCLSQICHAPGCRGARPLPLLCWGHRARPPRFPARPSLTCATRAAGARARLATGGRFLMRLILLASLGLLFAAVPVRAQVGFDRPGGDYANFPVRTGDPAQCALRCERDAHCRSWAFAYPTADAAAVCWLKSGVPARTEEPASVSGVRGAGVIAPRRGPVEFSIDRIGGDYKNMEIASDSTGMSCKAACEADNHCRAWSYQRPGYGGAAPR